MASISIRQDISFQNRPIQQDRINAAHLLPHLLVILSLTVFAFFAHELGHAIVAQLLGARVTMIHVLGFEWYPKIMWMPQVGFGGYVYWVEPFTISLAMDKFILAAGSTTTLLVSIVAVLTLTFLPLRGLTRTAFFVLACYFLDSLVHLAPILGLVPPGWSTRFTGSFAEAYFAALEIGFSREMYIGMILLLSAFISILLVRVLLHTETSHS